MSEHYFTLNNGYKIPCLGFGTFRVADGEEAEKTVLGALEAGYRHLDGAAIYRNEKSVGKAIKEFGLPRNELFVTSKLWNDNKGYENTLEAFAQTTEDLGLDYLDLYLIHWPIGRLFQEDWQEANAATWAAFEELYAKGKVKAIGISNFLPQHMEALLKVAKVKPMVNQIEFHPGYRQEEVADYARKHDILLEAWAPFANGEILTHPVLTEIAAKYQKTTAQLILRWVIQQGIVALAKSVTPERIKANLEVFDFEVETADMAKIDAIAPTGFSGMHPETNKF